VSTLVEGCPHLYTLDVSDYNLITDVGIVRSAERCPKLENLNLNNIHASRINITDVSLIRLAEVCPSLRSLGLAWYLSITEMGINKLTEGCVKLRSLDLCDLNITVTAMRKVSKRYPNLQIDYVIEHG
jgi:hypothetical protein